MLIEEFFLDDALLDLTLIGQDSREFGESVGYNLVSEQPTNAFFIGRTTPVSVTKVLQRHS